VIRENLDYLFTILGVLPAAWREWILLLLKDSHLCARAVCAEKFLHSEKDFVARKPQKVVFQDFL
jgi:hypothetical protein